MEPSHDQHTKAPSKDHGKRPYGNEDSTSSRCFQMNINFASQVRSLAMSKAQEDVEDKFSRCSTWGQKRARHGGRSELDTGAEASSTWGQKRTFSLLQSPGCYGWCSCSPRQLHGRSTVRNASRVDFTIIAGTAINAQGDFLVSVLGALYTMMICLH
ncbi:hypothetical protein GUITHDRAFT_143361 [Guillardia theta CCMP2712]|uniref:Uncharacterized protein n=1 Tax=Guillardia theta (strain CCMP2712) TaxID=905079 RepID=L1ITY3_GUITC|nr:hypothetical protein GUITHDRAFT_143361 [Guillardia theta CCMP2712]EKX39577.1 hypothetical protein GUITHDRAFT_143361 [Guillardia theta CCMP2712]|eukprot:XP_005826557.1 hypothetical protein GUITHDRAFT_143361 [Guillardia theta CCMP2712]